MSIVKKRDSETNLAYRARLYRNKVLLGLNNKEIYEMYLKETLDEIAESTARCSAMDYNRGADETLEIFLNKDFDKTIMVINDIHLPYEREDVLQIISKHSKEITTLVIAGDLMDCENASSFPRIKRGSLKDELLYAYDFMKKVRDILNKDQKIIIINGNHEERLATTIKKMNEKDLQEFLNPNILEMIVDGFTLYKDNKKTYYDGVNGITYIPHWYALVDDIVFAHPKSFSRIKGKLLESAVQHFVNKNFEFSGVVFGHTHKYSTGIVDRHCNKFAVENPCLCQPQSYSDCGKLEYAPQTYGYTIIRKNDNEPTDINNIKTYILQESVDVSKEYKVEL